MAAEAALGEHLCAWLEGETALTRAQSLAATEAWTALAEPAPEDLAAAALAVALSEAMTLTERDALLARPSACALLEAAEDFLTRAVDPAPQRMLEIAQSLLDPGSNVVTLQPRVPGIAQAQSFRLRAAASATQDRAVLCRSDSGIWMLEVFVERGGGDEKNASLLLSVDPDYQVTYEGLRAKVFVTVEGAERVLAEADVRDGELFAGISLEGLDLYARDAINVVFSPVPDDDAR